MSVVLSDRVELKLLILVLEIDSSAVWETAEFGSLVLGGGVKLKSLISDNDVISDNDADFVSLGLSGGVEIEVLVLVESD